VQEEALDEDDLCDIQIAKAEGEREVEGPCCATYMCNIMHSLIINPGFIINRVTRHQ
jgi:hypothetical protein